MPQGEEGDAPPRRRSFAERRAVAAATASSVGFAGYLSTFQPVEDGWMVSSTTKGAFDPRCAGMEAVVALEHGLLKSAGEQSVRPRGVAHHRRVHERHAGVLRRGRVRGRARGARGGADVHVALRRVARGGCAKSGVCVSSFPDHPPEMANLAWAENDKPASQREREAALEQGKEERLLPLPDAARLLPHGYLRRRLTDGRFIGMERLGGVIVTNDAAAAAAKAATRPSVESLSSFFQSGASLKSDEPSAHSSSSPSPATANATATGSDETAAARASPAFERPYPCFRTGADGAKRRDEHADTPEVATHVTTSETTEAEATSNAGREANDVERREAPTLDTYPPSPRGSDPVGPLRAGGEHSLRRRGDVFARGRVRGGKDDGAGRRRGGFVDRVGGGCARGVADVPDVGGRRGAEQVSPLEEARGAIQSPDDGG